MDELIIVSSFANGFVRPQALALMGSKITRPKNILVSCDKQGDWLEIAREYNESRLFLITRAWSSPEKMIDSRNKLKYSVTRTPLESQPSLGCVILGGVVRASHFKGYPCNSFTAL